MLQGYFELLSLQSLVFLFYSFLFPLFSSVHRDKVRFTSSFLPERLFLTCKFSQLSFCDHVLCIPWTLPLELFLSFDAYNSNLYPITFLSFTSADFDFSCIQVLSSNTPVNWNPWRSSFQPIEFAVAFVCRIFHRICAENIMELIASSVEANIPNIFSKTSAISLDSTAGFPVSCRRASGSDRWPRSVPAIALCENDVMGTFHSCIVLDLEPAGVVRLSIFFKSSSIANIRIINTWCYSRSIFTFFQAAG